MVSPAQHSPNPPPQRRTFSVAASARSQRGVALVLVLACLVIITILTVAFLQSVRTDLQASQGYASGSNARMLADSALNVVISQLQEATQRQDEAWVSQPGLIRTYDTSGQQVKAYKLYSADKLVVDAGTSGAFNPLDGSGQPVDVPSDWKTQGADVFTDLNAPILKENVPHYPIIDPGAMGAVEGFSAPTENLQNTGGNTIPNPAGGNYQTVPMPVKWLYVLRDGTRATAAPGAGGVVKLTSIDAARPVSKDNPPVARIAFWTDDEASKVNINTAAEGTYYDAPIANTYKRGIGIKEKIPMPSGYVPDPEKEVFDLDLAWFQPSKNEYQRYPGHPATTALSPLLYRYVEQALLESGQPAARVNVLEEIYKLNPKDPNGLGTSYSGTVRAPSNNNGTPTYPIGPKAERLYASLDELLFSPVFNTELNKRDENRINIDGKRRDLLGKIQFFATAHSKAPEVTLFNSPRVTIWPVSSEEAKRSTYDKLIAFSAEIPDPANPNDPTKATPYFYMRSNPLSMTDDWLIQKNGRRVNQDVYSYLQRLTSRVIPGFGGNFLAKYTAPERDQILTEVADYIRSTNLADKTAPTPYTRIPTGSNGDKQPDTGIVLPLEPPSGTPGAGTKGFGRYFSMSELCLAATDVGNDPDVDLPSGNFRCQFALIPEFYSAAVGHPQLAYCFRMEFKNLDNLKVDGKNLFQSPTHTIRSPHALVNGAGPQDLSYNGGPMGFKWYARSSSTRQPYQIYPVGEVVMPKGTTGTITGKVDIEFWYDPVVPTGSVSTLSPAPPAVLVQKGTFDFSGAAFQAPKRTAEGTMAASGNAGATFTYPPGYLTGYSANRLSAQSATAFILMQNGSSNNNGEPFGPIDPATGNTAKKSDGKDVSLREKTTDWASSLVPDMAKANSDYRITSAVPSNEDMGASFAAHPWWGQTITQSGGITAIQAHSLRTGQIDDSGGSGGTRSSRWKIGQLTEGLTTSELYETPDIVQPFPAPSPDKGVLNSRGKSGDWSNAVGQFSDGPLIDRADEGEKPTGASKIPYFGHYYSNRDDYVTGEQVETFFSPNRLMPSPVMLGSLPTGAKRGQPWQTLLFRPNKTYLLGEGTHPGADSPPDHLLLDLFWMPVVEPYAISERFSTAGKVNLNYQIAPFTNIKRTTGLRAVLKSVQITALDPFVTVQNENSGGSFQFSRRYKVPLYSDDSYGAGVLIRHALDMDATLVNFDDRFASNKPFVSASEICTIPFVPAGLGVSGASTPAQVDGALAAFWANRTKLTGDNSIERPYALTYPRVTCKSNTYQVHVRAQTLRVSNGSAAAGEFRPQSDGAEGEFRGSFIIERYLDPTLQTYNPSGTTGLGPYKVRVISSKQLAL